MCWWRVFITFTTITPTLLEMLLRGAVSAALTGLLRSAASHHGALLLRRLLDLREGGLGFLFDGVQVHVLKVL